MIPHSVTAQSNLPTRSVLPARKLYPNRWQLMETTQPNQQSTQPQRKPGFSTTLVVIIIVASLLGGGLIGYSITVLASPASNVSLQNQVNSLQQQVLGLQAQVNGAGQNYTYANVGNTSLAQIYAQVKDSVVVVQGYMVQHDIFGRSYYSGVQGSGFVYSLDGRMIIVTNDHVVDGTVNNTVTFANGDTYSASVLGSDPYADLAALSSTAPDTEYTPLVIPPG